MTTAMTKARLSWRDRVRYAVGGTPVVIYQDNDEILDGHPDAVVTARTRKVEVYRPPTLLDADGHAQAGIDADLFAHYMVAVVERAVGAEIGHAEVNFDRCVGRFAAVDMTLEQWGQTLAFMIPIGVISQEVKNVLDDYMAGLALKVGQAHRGRQDHTSANQLFDKAQRGIEGLRNDSVPHFANDAEYMFLVAQCQKARRYSPLMPVAGTEKVVDRTPLTDRR